MLPTILHLSSILVLYISSTVTPVMGLEPAIGVNLGPSYLTAAIHTDQDGTRDLVRIEGMYIESGLSPYNMFCTT